MTLGIAQVNSGAAFGSGVILPSADVNSAVGDAFLAWYSAISGMGRVTVLRNSCAPYVTGSSVNHLAYESTLGFIQHVIAVDGSIGSLAAPTLTFTSIGATAFSVQSQRWYVFASISTTTWYRSTDTTMATLTAATAMGAATAIYAATICEPTIDRVIAVGEDGAAAGKIGRFEGTSMVASYTSPTLSAFRSVAANGNGGVVAVADNGVAYSTDNGVNWSTGTFPTLPVTFDGHLSVSWSAATGFIVSGLLSTGHMFWSTSSTGATWQAWKRTSQVAVATSASFSAAYKTCGICAIGSAMISPYITEETSGRHVVGLLVSINSGASWRAIPGSSIGITLFNNLRAVAMGLDTRVAIVTGSGVLATPPVQLNDAANSVAT